MRNRWWIILMMAFGSSCLDSAECVKEGDTALVISFKNLSDGKDATVTLLHVTAEGTNNVFYKEDPDVLNTLTGKALLSVNPYAEETLFTFVFETEQRTLRVGYKNQVQFISEECGSDLKQIDLKILETQFDSVRVVNKVLTKDRTPNIEIFN